MKITVKTLQQKVFYIDAEGSDTVGDLKQKIQESQGHTVESQKLIYAGKVLPDSKSVESCEIREKDFLVLMVSKPKAAATPTASTSATPAASTTQPATTAPAAADSSVAAAPVIPQAPNAPILTPAQVAPVGPAEHAFGETSSFLGGERLEETIQNMVEMGFPETEVRRALRASFNNPDRAVEYLTNGIPAHLNQAAAASPPAAVPAAQTAAPVTPAAQPAAPAAQSAAAQPAQPQNLFQLAQQQQHGPGAGAGIPELGAAAAAAGGGAVGPAQLAALANHPQIQRLRALMIENPGLVQPVVEELAMSNPALARLFAAHPDMLAQILAGDGLGDDEEGGPLPPGAQIVHVTEEERAAIERLEALGFPRQTVIEAYFACDKDEQLAANYLFDNGFEDS